MAHWKWLEFSLKDKTWKTGINVFNQAKRTIYFIIRWVMRWTRENLSSGRRSFGTILFGNNFASSKTTNEKAPCEPTTIDELENIGQTRLQYLSNWISKSREMRKISDYSKLCKNHKVKSTERIFNHQGFSIIRIFNQGFSNHH